MTYALNYRLTGINVGVCTAVGNATVEIDEVTVIPWVIEDFEASQLPGWELPDAGVIPFVHEGELIVPPGGFAIRGGTWEEMTLHAVVQRDRLGTALLHYPGHMLRIDPNEIAFMIEEVEGQLQEIAGAPLPELPAEPEAATWMDVMVVVRNGEHHVLAHGIELFSVADEVTGGPLVLEPLQDELVLDRLMLGPPLPLWPVGIEPGGEEPDGGEPGGGEPGGTPSGVPSADLAVTDLFPDQVPIGRLYLRITNHGPDALQGVPVTVTCGGTATNVATGASSSLPDTPQGTLSITLAPGQTQAFPTQIDLDLSKFSYDMTCTASGALGSGAFSDPDTSNNTYSEHIEVLPQAQLIQADLAVTDIFPDSLPQGDVYCRITNHGPDALVNASVGLYTNALCYSKTPGGSTTSPANHTWITVTLQAGETGEFSTGLSVDTTSYWYDVACAVTLSMLDPDSSNDIYSERIGSPP